MNLGCSVEVLGASLWIGGGGASLDAWVPPSYFQPFSQPWGDPVRPWGTP